MVTVDVVNDPPKVTCSTLIAVKNTPRPIQVSECVSDPNRDPVSISLDGATGGTVERTNGTWYFVPTHDSTRGGLVLSCAPPTATRAHRRRRSPSRSSPRPGPVHARR